MAPLKTVFVTATLTVSATVGVIVAPVVNLPGPVHKPVAASMAFSPLATAAIVQPEGDSDQETREVNPKEDFNTVGVVWKAGESGGNVEVRVQGTDGEWDEWIELGPTDEGPDPDSKEMAVSRIGTEPVHVHKGQKVQVRAAKARKGVLDSAEVVTVDPGSSAADGKVEPNTLNTAESASPRPRIVTRAQWGANESYRNCDPSYAPTVRAVTLHHTTGPNNYSRAAAAARVRSIYAYHTRALGWCDVGYNALVDKYGTIYEGRAGGLDKAVRGAHASGFNNETWGVSMVGDNSRLVPSFAQREALAKLMAWKLSSYYRNPTAAIKLTSAGTGGTNTRYPRGAKVSLPTIFGHRDVGSTSCPGGAGYRILPALRKRVAQIAGSNASSPIMDRYNEFNGAKGPFGPMTQPETKVPGGSFVHFRNGAIFNTPNGVKFVFGSIGARYMAWGGPWGGMGLPTTDEYTVKGTKGRGQKFSGANGAIYWTPETGAQAIFGGINEHFEKSGGPAGAMGFPLNEEADIPKYVGAGRVQSFQGGQVYWGPRVGSFTVSGGTLKAFQAIGGAGVIGLPMSAERAIAGGVMQPFEIAHAAIYGKPGKTHQVVYGAVRKHYDSLGGPTSSLGFPTGPERATAGGRIQSFEGGSIFWNAATGQTSVR